jgi:hypothetical protein
MFLTFIIPIYIPLFGSKKEEVPNNNLHSLKPKSQHLKPIYLMVQKNHTRIILFLPNFTKPSSSNCFSNLETTTRTVPNSFAICSCVN